MEEKLLAAHAIVARVAGRLSLTISRRSVRTAYIIYWINELRQAADLLEQLVKKDPPNAK
jgi:hypothetical protein